MTLRAPAAVAASQGCRYVALAYEDGRLDPDGGPEVLEVQEWLDPPVAAGEVRIAVRAAGLNFAGTMARVGFYPAAPKTPCVLGYEVAGEVGDLR
ncbi:MAG TPA: hypothetical protein VFP81_10950, partial [Propionibacteriaceae bacterium]|nr:hypothetical protein [Propionibacteriaceae bacterium]